MLNWEMYHTCRLEQRLRERELERAARHAEWAINRPAPHRRRPGTRGLLTAAVGLAGILAMLCGSSARPASAVTASTHASASQLDGS
jgi:ferric-dicitrate binding protein FerR (iron transport regulator)